MPKEELLKIVTVGEAYSEHPLARANLSYADKELGRFDEKQTEVNYIPGQGILGQTTVIIGNEQRVLGMISIADPVRKEAKQVIQRLKSSGIQRVVMLTGDNPRAAKAISGRLGIDEAYSELLPQDKVRILKELQNKYGSIAMVGDGVNDAPALAAADLGIAMGGTGSDITMETGDVVLMSGNVSGLAYGLNLSRAREASTLCMIQGDKLKELVTAYPSVAIKIMEELSRRL